MPRPDLLKRASITAGCVGVFALGAALLPAGAQDKAAPSSADVARAMSAMMVAPLRVDLPTAETAQAIRVQNTSAGPLAVQVRLFSWSQQAGNEQFAPSSDLLVTPSIVSIPAGQTQIVRVVRKGPAGAGEKQFKLVIDQLPDPTQAKAGVAMTRIRFALPVFVDTDRAAPARFEWQLSDGELRLRNSGGATARIARIEVKGVNGQEVPVELNSLRYVFGSNTIAWPVSKGCSFGKVRVTAQIDGQTVDAEPAASCG